MNDFIFKFFGNIYFGLDKRNVINSIINNHGYKKVCIIIDHNLLNLSIIDNYINHLK